MTRTTSARLVLPGLAIAAIAAVPASADAATPVRKPTVTTGISGSVTPQSAVVTGAVGPRGAPTTYRFDVGVAGKGFTIKTPSTRARPAEGATKAAVNATLTGLATNTAYRYRLVAHNSKGTVRGKIRTFRTRKQPLGFELASSPTTIGVGDTSTIAGTLGGTGGGQRQVVLQAQPFPYTAPFVTVGNPQVTNATGGFAFPVLNIGISTRYRVSTTGKKPTGSPVVGVGVRSDVTSSVSRHKVRRNAKLRFSGKAHPASVGVAMAIAKKDSKGRWKTIGTMKTRAGGQTFARWSKSVTIRGTGGLYRAELRYADGSYAESHGGSIRIRTRR